MSTAVIMNPKELRELTDGKIGEESNGVGVTCGENGRGTPIFFFVFFILFLKSQVVLLQTAHYWANAGVLLGGRMHRERGSFRNN